jgi:hypothetical protein
MIPILNETTHHQIALSTFIISAVSGLFLLRTPVYRLISQLLIQFVLSSIQALVKNQAIKYATPNKYHLTSALLETYILQRYYSSSRVYQLLHLAGFIFTLTSQIILFTVNLEEYTKSQYLRQKFTFIRTKYKFIPINEILEIFLNASIQLSIGNFLNCSIQIIILYKTFTNYSRLKTVQKIPVIVDDDPKGIFKSPILDGEHSLHNVAIYSSLLGVVSGLGLHLSLQDSIFSYLGTFFQMVSLYHLLEYYTTAKYQLKRTSLSCIVFN